MISDLMRLQQCQHTITTQLIINDSTDLCCHFVFIIITLRNVSRIAMWQNKVTSLKNATKQADQTFHLWVRDCQEDNIPLVAIIHSVWNKHFQSATCTQC